MTAPFWSVFVAFLVLWATGIPAEGASAPAEGLGARALAAHEGLRTGFAPFAAAVVIAQLAGADTRRMAVLSIAFVVTQVIYVVAHLGDADYLRIFAWLVGFSTTLGLFALAWTA